MQLAEREHLFLAYLAQTVQQTIGAMATATVYRTGQHHHEAITLQSGGRATSIRTRPTTSLASRASFSRSRSDCTHATIHQATALTQRPPSAFTQYCSFVTHTPGVVKRRPSLGGLTAPSVTADGLGAGMPRHALYGRNIGTGAEQIANKGPPQIVW
jgi:hypothetical protein